MEQTYQPARLDLLALGEWVKIVGRGLMQPVYSVTQRDPNCGHLFLQLSLDCVGQTLYDIFPICFFDQMAMKQVFTSINQLIYETKSDYSNYNNIASLTNKMKVAVHLNKILMQPQLKKLVVSDWPNSFRHLLHQNLDKLVGLETLDLQYEFSGMDSSEIEYILSSVQRMSKLTTFCFSNCTDTVISFLGRGCPHLQKIDVTYSRSVTDSSIPFLLRCSKLLTIYLHETSVSPNGYMELLSELPSIQDIGMCNKIDKVLKLLHENNSNPLTITSLQYRDLTEEQLRLLKKYFPRLQRVSQ